MAEDVIVSGAGTGPVNDTYTDSGTFNGRDYWNRSGTATDADCIVWNSSDTRWEIYTFIDLGQQVAYWAAEDVAYPGLVSEWTVVSGEEPAPTVTGGEPTENNYEQNLGGSVTAAGSVKRAASATKAGSSTSAGAVQRTAASPAAGSATPAGSLAKAAGKPGAGSVTPSGLIAKAIAFAFGGSTTAAGALETLRVVLQTVTGSITAAGALLRSAAPSLLTISNGRS